MGGCVSASMVLLSCAAGEVAGSGGGGAAGTCRRWPQDGQGFLVPPSLAGDSRGFLQFGQLYRMGGCVSASMVLLSCAAGEVAGSGGGGAAGTCRRWPPAGQGVLEPLSLAGDAGGFFARGWLSGMGASPWPRIVWRGAGAPRPGGCACLWGPGAPETEAPATKGDWQLGQIRRVPIAASGR